ncbi:MAG: hypothetical protein WBQ43_10420 [Terriglobales bacterium]
MKHFAAYFVRMYMYGIGGKWKGTKELRGAGESPEFGLPEAWNRSLLWAAARNGGSTPGALSTAGPKKNAVPVLRDRRWKTSLD